MLRPLLLVLLAFPATAGLPVQALPEEVQTATSEMNGAPSDDVDAGMNTMARTEAMSTPTAAAPPSASSPVQTSSTAAAIKEAMTRGEDWMPPAADQAKLASESYEDATLTAKGENLMNAGDTGVDEQAEAEAAHAAIEASESRMNDDDGLVSNGDMDMGPSFGYAVAKAAPPAASMGGGDADAEDDESGAGAGDMNGEGAMNGDVRMNTISGGMGRMPLSSDPSIAMDSPEREEPSAFTSMNRGSVAAASAPAPAVMRAAVAPGAAVEMAAGGKRSALLKALAVGDLGLQGGGEQHVSAEAMRQDNSMEMADMSHVHPAARIEVHPVKVEKEGFMDEGDPTEMDIQGQMNASPSSGLDMMGPADGVAALLQQSQYSQQQLGAPEQPQGRLGEQSMVQFSGHQYAQGPPVPPPGTASPLVPITPIMNGTEPIKVPIPMHPYGVPYFHRDPFMPLQTPYYHTPAFDNPQKNPALTPYYNPYVNPPPPIPPSVPAAPSFFPYHHHQHMIPPYFPYPPAPIIQPGPFAPYALPSYLAPGKLGPDAAAAKLPPPGEDPF